MEDRSGRRAPLLWLDEACARGKREGGSRLSVSEGRLAAIGPPRPSGSGARQAAVWLAGWVGWLLGAGRYSLCRLAWLAPEVFFLKLDREKKEKKI